MIYRSNNVLIAGPDFAALYTVTALPVGAVAASVSSGNTITVEAGHGFAVGDKILVWDGTTATFYGNVLDSVTTTTLVFLDTSVTIAKGNLICNLGPDSATGATPAYDASPMFIYSDSDGDDRIIDSRVTTSALGTYEYYTYGDGRSWELIRDSAGTVASVLPGWGGVPSRYNVCDFGATRNGSNNTRLRCQVAIDAAKDIATTTGDTINVGAPTYWPIGTYLVNGALILPKASNTTHPRSVNMIGDGPNSTVIKGGSTGFSAGDGVIMWESTVAHVWDQEIRGLSIWAPSVLGTHAIAYTPSLLTTWAEVNAEAFTLIMDNVECDGQNEYHSSLIRIKGISRHSRFTNVRGDTILTSRAYDTMLFQFDETLLDGSEQNAFDVSGCNWGHFENIWTTPQRGGHCGFFKGRMAHSHVDVVEVGNGSYSDPILDLNNSVGNSINNLWSEARGEQPQIKLTDSHYNSFNKLMLGHPNDAGGGMGNGIELIGSSDNFIERVGDDTGFVSFATSGVKLFTLDANSARNRVIVSGRSTIDATFDISEEFTDSGTDNWITYISQTDSREFHRGGPIAASLSLREDRQAQLDIKSISEEIALANGVATHDSTANLLPATSIILAMGARWTGTPGGSLTYTVGAASGDTTRFSSSAFSAAAGNEHTFGTHWNEGTEDIWQSSADKLRLTTSGNTTDGNGLVRVTVWYIQFTTPQVND